MYDISISIITYNRKELLAKVIGSLERQTYPMEKFEIVVVDDGSTDGTDKVMEAMLTKSPCHIKYLPQVKNEGKAAVRNISITEAEGRIMLFLEDDTVADPRLVEEHVKSHQSEGGQNVAVLGEQVRPEDSIVTPFGRYIVSTSRTFFDHVQGLLKAWSCESYKGFITFNLSVSRGFLLEKGMFDPIFKYFCEDIELGYRLQEQGLRLVCNKKAKIYDYHPPYLDEYAKRNINRGYYNRVLAKKHPKAVNVSFPAGKVKYICKDIFYPILMVCANFMDRYLKMPMPFFLYRKILDYYLEKGVRLACERK
ncbi:MAG: glycosyltransferase family 2 protein [Candidatus Omnitrophica bacterium]|nr:glycosyltransferase family 2 protein [Candidatus Omnitrophota bacterium]